MADHMYKPSEVPKGERWQQFLDYYKIPTIITILAIIAVISIVKTTVFAPQSDINLLVVAESPVDYSLWDEMGAAFEALPVDFNEDGKKLVSVDTICLDPDSQKSDPEYFQAQQMKLMATLSTANAALQIVDEAMFSYLQSEGLAGTYSELPFAEGHDPDEVVKIPLKELKPFKDFEALSDTLFITVRPKAAMQIGNSEKKLNTYLSQLKALEYMLEP